MAHQSLYRRFRPQRFDEIKGQDHVVRALRNAAAEDRIGHAYLFSGPRGTGKTSTARILAKVLNCADPADGEPCGVCESCVAIAAGTSFDVTELDAASNRRIDDVRDLIATTALSSPGRTRLYILDEVHMLTKEASAALLKTLEEPPDHVVFVLATTDPQLVLPTIRSRTQHLEFSLLPAEELGALVDEIVEDAGLDVDDDGVARALRDGAGSARDTLSALDRIVAAGGVVDEGETTAELLDALSARDTGAALVALHHAVGRGRDPRVVGEQLLAELRDAFLVLMQGDAAHLTDAARDRARAHAEQLRAPAITRALEAVGEALVEMRQSADPRVPLEVALVRLTRVDLDPSPAALVERLERLERQPRPTDAPPPVGGRAEPDAASSPGDSPAAGARARLAATAPPAAEGPRTDSPAEGQPANPPDEPSVRARPAMGRRRTTPDAATSDRPADEAAPEDGAGGPAPDAGTAPADPAPREASGTADTPNRDEITLAWGDTLLDALRPKLRALFAAGRFVAVEDGTAHFALPNDAHRGRCEAFRGDVEEVLAEHFGRPVPLALVVEVAGGADGTAGKPDTTDDGGEEVIDVGELEDAGAAATGVDQLADVFGAVEVVEQPEEGAP